MDFCFFSTINWDVMSGAHQPVRLARELARRGHRVLYIQTEPLRIPAVEHNVLVLTANELGLPERAFRRAWHGIAPVDLGPFLENLVARLREFEGESNGIRVALWSAPFVPFVMAMPELRARGYFTVYDCIDDFQSLADLGYRFGNSAAEHYLVDKSDLTMVVSAPLLEKWSGVSVPSRVRLLREGVDPAEFRPQAIPAAPPADLARGERTLGFWGLVNDFNVDVLLISFLARERPAWAINLIGPIDPDPERRPVAKDLHLLPNVHLLGAKPHDELARYLYWFDVALIPYPNHPFNSSRDPIKVWEYLAGYKPVVATYTPQLAATPNVYPADTPDGLLAAVECALRQPVDRHMLDDYLETSTWSARVDTLLAWIADLPRQQEMLPPVSPEEFYPPVDLPPNVAAFVAHAEQLLDERTAYIRHMEAEWQRTQEYLRRLERTHPLVQLKRGIAPFVGTPRRSVPTGTGN